MTKYSFIIALLPLLSFLMIVFFMRWKEKLSAWFSIAMILVSWVMSIIVLIETIGNHGVPYEAFYEFLAFPQITFQIGILIDALAAVMLVVVTTIGASVEIYSVGYMKDDPRFSRFFAYLSLFLFSMLGLVLANNFFMIFIFWELVGLTSYLLIGFWFEKKSASDACKKAFITTRIGDLGFMVGLFMLAFYVGTFNYGEVFDKVGAGLVPAGILTAIALFVFCGAVGKSAQFPLHVWLPDAMEGPTPVSALIHAATMVAAGVYLVARSMALFVGSAEASLVVACIGLITSLLAAAIAITGTVRVRRRQRSSLPWLLRRYVSPDDSRILQGPAVFGCRLGYSRRAHQQHSGDGRASAQNENYGPRLPDCVAVNIRYLPVLRVLVER